MNDVVSRLRLLNKPDVWFTGAVILTGLISSPFVIDGGEPDLPSICYVSSILAIASLISIRCTVLGDWKTYLIGAAAFVLYGLAFSVMGPFGLETCQ